MYASEYSYPWLIRAHEEELTIQLERRRIALERQQGGLDRAGATERETWHGRALRPVRGRSRRLAAVHPAPHD